MPKSKVFLWSLVCLGLLAIGYFFVAFANQNSTRDAAQFQSQFLKESKKVEENITQLIQKFEEKELYEFSPNEESSYFIYVEDSLVYWSEDISGLNYLQLASELELIKSSNAWHYKHIQRHSDTLYVGLLLIQYDYSFQNEFLRNSFNSNLESGSFDRIDLEDGTVKINNREGEFLFSLKAKHSKKPNWLKYLVLLLLISASSLFLLKFPKFFFRKKYQQSLFVIISTLFIRALLYFFLPEFIRSLPLFQESQFAISFFSPSLGDFLLHILSLFIVIYQLKKMLITKESRALSVFLFTVAILFSIYSIELISESVRSSIINLDFNNLFKLNSLSFIVFITHCLLVLINLNLLHLAIGSFRRNFSRRQCLLFIITASGLLILLALLSKPIGFPHIWAVFPLFLLNWYYDHSDKRNILLVIVLLLYSSSIIAITINTEDDERKNIQQRSIIEKLAEERDPVAEYLFNEAQEKIRNDDRLLSSIQNYWSKKSTIDDYLTRTYFNSYWDKYEKSYTVCSAEDTLLINGSEFSCFNYFQSRIELEGDGISTNNLFLLKNFAGRIDYIGEINLTVDSVNYRLYIDLNSVYLNENEGYPELLIDEKSKRESLDLDDYSYAVYDKNELVYKNGKYNYSINLKINELTPGSFYQYQTEDFQHIAFQKDNTTTIVLSQRSVEFFGFLTSMAYLSVFLSILFFFFAIFLPYFPFYFTLNIHDFSTKIQLFLIGSLLTSLILLAWGTTYYIEKQYQEKNISNLNEKIRSVNLELESKIGKEEYLAEPLQDYVANYLVKFSNVFYSDINLYKKDGSLYATSRPEVFIKGVKSKRINPQAFNALTKESKAQWTQEENIGEMKYLSTYIPFKNYNNETLGYLNLPYFAKQGELEKEISSFLISTLNIYVAIFALALLISVLLINQLSKPLLLIRQQISKLKLGSSIELIDWKSKDEIGALVQEYNRIAVDLSESAEELAKSEREVAWREMAKQVAHEIKNPLTPMKLSIQHLQMAANSKSDDLEERINRTTQTLVEQIETLSGIATAFSSFAKLPSKEFEELQLLTILKNAIDLYSHDTPIQFKEKAVWENIKVNGDKDQLLRVFNNLLKNAVQAVENKEKPLIRVEIINHSQTVEILIQDNGVGISELQAERIFEPNFTTKSSGSGLGLAMSKNIVQQMKGNISFESVESMGTTFKIEFPKA